MKTLAYPKLKPEVKAAWLADLRSGKLRQTRGRLARELNKRRSYCCLGVLCRLKGRPEILRPLSMLSQLQWDGASAVPPESVSKFAFARGSSAAIAEAYSVLAGMNDGTGYSWMNHFTGERMPDKKYSFSEIADWIEANL